MGKKFLMFAFATVIVLAGLAAALLKAPADEIDIPAGGIKDHGSNSAIPADSENDMTEGSMEERKNSGAEPQAVTGDAHADAGNGEEDMNKDTTKDTTKDKNKGTDNTSDDSCNTPRKLTEISFGGDIDVIFRPDLPRQHRDNDGDGIFIIVEPKESIQIDPESAEQLRKGAEDAKKLLTGLFRTTLDVEQSEDGLVLDFSLENISGTDLEYYSGSSQKYDYIIYNSKNDEVFRWSNKMCFLTVITETRHRKGDTLSFREVWDYTCNDGNRVPPGEYWVLVRMIAKMHGGSSVDPDELTAKSYFTVD